METALQPVVAALAESSDAELQALIDATNQAPKSAPELLAWIATACEWDLNRRAGMDYELEPPDAAMASDEDEASVDAAMALLDQFAKDSPAVVALLDAVVDLFTGEGGRKA